MKNLSRAIVGALFVVFLSFSAMKSAMAQDPVKVAPDHYKVLLDNDRVRVLEVHVRPGEKTAMHSHPATIIYSFTDAKTKFTLRVQRVRRARLRPATWSGALLRNTPVRTPAPPKLMFLFSS